MIQALGFDVSRETSERLEIFADLLRRWNPRINLVAASTLADLWTRHIVDSAQLYALAPKAARSWVDLGSGGGFPGLVVAILRHEHAPDLRITLIEGDTRKCAFLRSALREVGVAAEVCDQRIETAVPMQADVVSARALAPLDRLLNHVARHIAPGGVALLPKGARWQEEHERAMESWRYSLHTHPSRTDPSAAILQIEDLVHA